MPRAAAARLPPCLAALPCRPPDLERRCPGVSAQNFGEHGRELISSEIGLSVLRLLCDAEARAPLLTKYKIDPAAVSSVLQRAVFKVCVQGWGSLSLRVGAVLWVGSQEQVWACVFCAPASSCRPRPPK